MTNYEQARGKAMAHLAHVVHYQASPDVLGNRPALTVMVRRLGRELFAGNGHEPLAEREVERIVRVLIAAGRRRSF